jgi:undecaprenyl diphosphate synthase
LVFVDKLWPDFGKDDLAASILEYQQRDRRYGAAAKSG